MLVDDAAAFLGCSKRTVQRYIENSKLPYTTRGTKKHVKKKDLFKIANELHGNTAKHRPDKGEPKEKPLSKVKEMRTAISSPSTPLLNAMGKKILLNTTKIIQDNNLLTGIDKSTILRYAIAVQMKDHYLSFFKEDGDPFYLNTAKVFQTEIQHYEKELGLTPAALRKLKPVTEEEEIIIDPMEELLNGGK